MFKNISKKLKNNSGSTITFALIFFLIVTIIGTMILTASKVSIGRANRLKEGRAAYYISVSTFKLIKSELDEETVNYNHDTSIDNNIVSNSSGKLAMFNRFLMEGYNEIITSGNDYEEELKIKFDDPQTNITYTVTLDAKISSFDYSIIFKITNITKTKDGEDTLLKLNRLTKITFDVDEVIEDDNTNSVSIKYLEGKPNG